MSLQTLEIVNDLPAEQAGFLSATILPERGMMLLQARLRLPSGQVVDALQSPDVAEADRRMGGADDFVGNQSFGFGGAVLAPYANRITGRPAPDAREIEARVGDRTVRLPANWSGKAPGAQAYAMHGLMLAAAAEVIEVSPARLRGRVLSSHFAGAWPGALVIEVGWTLSAGVLQLDVIARNDGDETAPVGIGWHPWFALPSGRRGQARLKLPARLRCEVEDYDAVLPTGRLLAVQGTAYDFNGPEGGPLPGHLDDAFTGLVREVGHVVVEILDPAADLRLKITSASQGVKTVQVYAPKNQAVVVVEPQFNLADPFNPAWPPSTDTGMVWLEPGASASYVATVRAGPMRNRAAP